MAGTLTVTVTDAGAPEPDALVRAYRLDGTLAGEARTPANGQVSFTVEAGDYRVHVDPVSSTYLPQWYGSGDAETSPAFTVADAGTTTVAFILQLPLSPADAEARVQPLFWRDTTTDQVLALYPGQEREAHDDPQSNIYQHVLRGPYLRSADAATA